MFRFILFASVLLISFSANAAPEFNPARNADMQMKGMDVNKNGTAELIRTIHEYCRALAGSFVRNKFFLPQGTLSAASGIHLVNLS